MAEMTGRRGWHWAVRAGGLTIGTNTVQPEQAGCAATQTPAARARGPYDDLLSQKPWYLGIEVGRGGTGQSEQADWAVAHTLGSPGMRTAQRTNIGGPSTRAAK